MIISVSGFEEAKSYPVMYSNSELLMDNNKDVFYIKSVDSMGKYSIKTYEFHQVENDQPVVVTQEQFNALQSKLDTLIASIGGNLNAKQYTEQQSSSIPTQPVNAPATAAIPTNI